MLAQHPQRILIVEDEASTAADLGRRLELAGYRVAGIATDEAGAMTAIHRHEPDLVLIDMHLKGAHDGIHLANRVRRRHDIPVVFVAARVDCETLERARITEPFGYLLQPFSSVLFRPTIEMALWKHAMAKRIKASEGLFPAISQPAVEHSSTSRRLQRASSAGR